MKKTFNFYAICWAISLAVYNLVVFLVKPILPGYVIHYDARFWISWVVILAAFAGQLFCAKTAFDSKNKEKLFLNLPLITQSYSSLVSTMIIGSALMLIPNFPAWIAAIICFAIFGFSAISVIKAKAAAEIIGEVDDKIKVKTSFIKTLTIDAESLVARAQSEEAKAATKKVYEAARYSDPMSSDGLYGIESEISIKFNQLAGAVSANSEDIKSLAEEVVVLIGDRNKRCKLLK